MRALVVVVLSVLLPLVLVLVLARGDEPTVPVHTIAPTSSTSTAAPTKGTAVTGKREPLLRPTIMTEGYDRNLPNTAAPSERCGGDLPPCYVMRRESSGNIHAYNPDGCNGRGCYGKWQCDPRTCDGTGTEDQQDAEARRVWDHGRGCAHWAAC